jgi:hypothetical protein
MQRRLLLMKGPELLHLITNRPAGKVHAANVKKSTSLCGQLHMYITVMGTKIPTAFTTDAPLTCYSCIKGIEQMSRELLATLKTGNEMEAALAAIYAVKANGNGTH